MKCLIFFATYNEAGNVRPLVEKIVEVAPEADILVVDDNSNDGTLAILREMRSPRLHALVRPGKLGLGTAHLLAWKYAIHKRYDVLITMDGDQSHDADDIPRLIKKLDSGFDLVIGSRYTDGGVCDYTGYRKHVSKMGNIAARSLLQIRLSEFTTSFRAFRVATLKRMDFNALNVGGYSFFMTAVVQAFLSGLRIAEVPIHFRERGYGASKIPPLEVISGMSNLLRLTCVRLFVTRPVERINHELPCSHCGTAFSKIASLRPPPKRRNPASVVSPRKPGPRDNCLFCGAPAKLLLMLQNVKSAGVNIEKR